MSKFPRVPRAAKPPKPHIAKVARGVPDDQTLLDALVANRELDVGDLAKQFGLKGDDRRLLRQRLKYLSEAGHLDKRGRKTFGAIGALPDTGVCEVVEADIDGELWVQWGKPDEKVKAPLARLAPLKETTVQTPPAVGDRIFARFEKTSDGWVAHLIKVLDQGAPKVVGVVRIGRQRKGSTEFRLESVSRKTRENYILTGQGLDALEDGDVVVAAPAGGITRYGPKPAKVIEVIGKEDEPKVASIMSIHSHGLSIGFNADTELEAKSAKAPGLGKRTDLRDLPFITIDP
ncbi:MAG TPA: ribonuclease R, partial [Asticcacaulis sp.]|nr:ribonuclease R [Asticcacaulis sp.]